MSTGDGVIEYVALGLYWAVVLGNEELALYWGRCGRVCRCRSLLGRLW